MIPSYLRNYEADYAADPRAAALKWLLDARYGLFLHYGLYSILGRHEWVQHLEKIPVAEYAKLKDSFTAERFDAGYIADLAVDAGMGYVNITTRHHDSFCLFETKETDFNSVNSPAKRDLVDELAEACDKRGLGLFLYYSHGRDWRHPHAPNNDDYPTLARPAYDPPEPSYAYGADHDISRYVDFMSAQITELLTNYGPIAGIWLDGIVTPLSGNVEVFKLQELYDMIHSLQPQTLVSYKQGVTGTEDYLSPERNAIEGHNRPCDVCTTMCPDSWGYRSGSAGTHLKPDDVWEKLRSLLAVNCNLLLNTGPLPDGSIDPEDDVVLRAVGARLRAEGWPA